ncbi:MAG: hypothetical protein HY821_04830 [Acidobacteria bacterium]|nr:hypothetical protein [Acidobacteriota bacterium]
MLVLTALIAYPVWLARNQRHFADSLDDGIYWITAKSIADGDGYRVVHQPGRPFAVKYPPLYPLYLSLAWKLGGQFPENLRYGAALQAALIPPYAALLLFLMRQLRTTWRRSFLVTALAVVTFHLVLVAATLMSELLFCCFLLAALLALERAGSSQPASSASRWALAGGALTAIAYLTRSAAAPLYLAVPIFFFLRKRLALTLWFALLAVPPAIAWHLWSYTHASAVLDPVNSGYLQEYVRIIGATGLWGHIGQQVATLSGATAEGLFAGVSTLLGGQWLPQPLLIFGTAACVLVLVTGISGCVRLGRRLRWPIAVIFTGLYLLQIVVWWFDGLGRLMLPVWPMLLLGIAEELHQFLAALAKSLAGPRASTAHFAAWNARLHWIAAACAAVLIAHNDAYAWRRIAQIVTESYATRQLDEDVFRRVKSEADPETVLLTWKDSAAYLYTGIPASHGHFATVTPQSISRQVMAKPFSCLPEQYRKGLLVVLRTDIDGPFTGRESALFRQRAEALPAAQLLLRTDSALVYRFQIPGRQPHSAQ